jgi:hypothetical protein
MRGVEFNADELRVMLSDSKLVKSLQACDPNAFALELWDLISSFAQQFERPEGIKKGLKILHHWLVALGHLHQARVQFAPKAEMVSFLRQELVDVRVALETRKSETDSVEQHLALLRSMYRAAVRSVLACVQRF